MQNLYFSGGEKTIKNQSKCFLCLIITFLLSTSSINSIRASSNDKDYHVFIKYYVRNNIYVEFAQIRGMKNEKKQKEINYLLEHEVFAYLTELYNSWGQIDNPNYKVTNILQTINDDESWDLDFVCSIGLSNENILSIKYSVCVYRHMEYGSSHPNTWGYAFNIDLSKEKVLTLDDFMTVDERLIKYDNGKSKRDDGITIPIYSSFKDAFPRPIENWISNKKDWYLDLNGDIVIFYIHFNSYGRFTIFHKDIKSLIYPHYYSALPN